MRALALRIAGLRGWRRRGVAFSAGAFGALALAPLSIAPALVVTFVTAVWLLDGVTAAIPATSARPIRRGLVAAFGCGYWLGFGYFLAGFWWLGSAFLVDREFLWALPLGVVGLPALLALFTGAGFVVARLLWSQGVARVFALAIGLGLAEWARGHLFTGFPWNSFGMGLGGNLVTAQLAALIGLDGLDIVTVVLFAMPATLADGETTPWRPTLGAGAALLAILAFGALRLAQGSAGNVPGATIRIMQPGLIPDDAFSYDNRREIVSRYIALSQVSPRGVTDDLVGTKLLIWPESAFPFILLREPDLLDAIGAMLPQGTTLVTGAAREQPTAPDRGRPQYSVYYNDMLAIGRGGVLRDTYDKVHLVPFGEYLPFETLLRRLGLHNFVAIPGGFVAGSSRKTLAVPGFPPALPLICYEAIFPDAVAADVRDAAQNTRPGYLLNITNDGWFGLTAGPYQHFAQVRLRAIEQGLPLIRGAATGISAIVDPYGRIVAALPLGSAGTLDGLLPKPIRRSFFAANPGLALLLVWIANVVAWVVSRYARHRQTRSTKWKELSKKGGFSVDFFSK